MTISSPDFFLINKFTTNCWNYDCMCSELTASAIVLASSPVCCLYYFNEIARAETSSKKEIDAPVSTVWDLKKCWGMQFDLGNLVYIKYYLNI